MLIKKLISLSFLSLKCHHSSSPRLSAALAEASADRLVFRDWRARGEENVFWGPNSVGYEMGWLGLPTVLHQCQAELLRGRSTLVFRNTSHFWCISEMQGGCC